MDQMYQALKKLRSALGARDGDCHKKAYATRNEACDFAEHVDHYHGLHSRPYLCWCGHWHLTSAPLWNEVSK